MTGFCYTLYERGSTAGLMNSAWKKLAFVLPLAMSASAFNTVATLTSDEPFKLDGRSVAITGVSSWPMVLDDQIETLSAPAVLVLQNGTKIQVSAHSRVKLSGTSKQPKIVVESGKIVELGSELAGNEPAKARPLATSGGGGPHAPISPIK